MKLDPTFPQLLPWVPSIGKEIFIGTSLFFVLRYFPIIGVLHFDEDFHILVIFIYLFLHFNLTDNKACKSKNEFKQPLIN